MGQGFWSVLSALLSFFPAMFNWLGSQYVFDDSVHDGITVSLLDLFVSFVILYLIITFAYQAILKRKVNRNENV